MFWNCPAWRISLFLTFKLNIRINVFCRAFLPSCLLLMSLCETVKWNESLPCSPFSIHSVSFQDVYTSCLCLLFLTTAISFPKLGNRSISWWPRTFRVYWCLVIIDWLSHFFFSFFSINQWFLNFGSHQLLQESPLGNWYKIFRI